MKKLGKKLNGSQATIEAFANCRVCQYCGCSICWGTSNWIQAVSAENGTVTANNSNQNP
ncbi:CLI_3235 family bacteriocin precursor [Anaerocolumna chitinilytica]|uniref:Bacteriocin n=1 Tax=Anaerocolumna chitinilytica TaxID=1727145 RepID=A0A7I8DQV5_9FIRM|nr:CLI_3235 family bacteriocin precursor [Anaerocolumna chitinilytica]BCK00801.1 hypothetical protein bsdcttw_38410 [Anaerocolumna chitinilytica]